MVFIGIVDLSFSVQCLSQLVGSMLLQIILIVVVSCRFRNAQFTNVYNVLYMESILSVNYISAAKNLDHLLFVYSARATSDVFLLLPMWSFVFSSKVTFFVWLAGWKSAWEISEGATEK